MLGWLACVPKWVAGWLLVPFRYAIDVKLVYTPHWRVWCVRFTLSGRLAFFLLECLSACVAVQHDLIMALPCFSGCLELIMYTKPCRMTGTPTLRSAPPWGLGFGSRLSTVDGGMCSTPLAVDAPRCTCMFVRLNTKPCRYRSQKVFWQSGGSATVFLCCICTLSPIQNFPTQPSTLHVTRDHEPRSA